MAIKGPKGAHPTTRGWESAKGELLKSQKISEDQIAEWNGEMNPKPQVLREAPVTEEEVIEEHMKMVLLILMKVEMWIIHMTSLRRV